MGNGGTLKNRPEDKKLMMMHMALNPWDDFVFPCQEKDEDDSSVGRSRIESVNYVKTERQRERYRDIETLRRDS